MGSTRQRGWQEVGHGESRVEAAQPNPDHPHTLLPLHLSPLLEFLSWREQQQQQPSSSCPQDTLSPSHSASGHILSLPVQALLILSPDLAPAGL